MLPAPRRRAAHDFAEQVDAAERSAGDLDDTVHRLRTVAPALQDATAPRPEFAAALRTRVVAVAEVQGMSSPASPPPAVRGVRLRPALVGSLAALVLLGGVAGAGSQSLPGDPFYGVKRVAESAQLRVTESARSRGERHLQLAVERLHEARGLVHGRASAELVGPDSGTPTARRVTDTLRDMDGSVVDGRAALIEAWEQDNSTPTGQLLWGFSTQQQAELAALVPKLPLAVRPDVEASLELLATVQAQADVMLGGAAPAPDASPTPGAPVVPDASLPPGPPEGAPAVGPDASAGAAEASAGAAEADDPAGAAVSPPAVAPPAPGGTTGEAPVVPLPAPVLPAPVLPTPDAAASTGQPAETPVPPPEVSLPAVPAQPRVALPSGLSRTSVLGGRTALSEAFCTSADVREHVFEFLRPQVL